MMCHRRTVARRAITNNLPFTTLAKSLLIAAMGGRTDDDADADVDDARRNSIVASIGPRVWPALTLGGPESFNRCVGDASHQSHQRLYCSKPNRT